MGRVTPIRMPCPPERGKKKREEKAREMSNIIKTTLSDLDLYTRGKLREVGTVQGGWG